MKCFFMHEDKTVELMDLKPSSVYDEVEYQEGLYSIREGGTFLYSEDGKKYERASFWKVGNPQPFGFVEHNKGIPSKVLGALMAPRIWRMLAKGDEHPYLLAIIILNIIVLVFTIIGIAVQYGNPLAH